MGLSFFGRGISSCLCTTNIDNDGKPTNKYPNPDPRNYKIIEYHEVSGFVIMKVKYPDCSNFEGEKVLVFKETSRFKITSKNFLDPHFCKNSKLIARFVPTKEGYKMAINLCKMLSDGDNQ